MRKFMLTAAVLVTVVFCSVAYSEMKTGAPDITIPSGKKKSVQFPHKTHQTMLKDCTICHDTFPMEAGSIKKMIDDGSLKKKKVMDQCRKCHKKMKKAGEKSGPTSCGSCHSG